MFTRSLSVIRFNLYPNIEDIMKGISSGKGDGGDEKGEKVVEDKKVVEEKNQNVDKKKKEGIDKFSN